ncbi:MAG: DUF6541 family protein, partial [Thermoplasmata archaeon]
TGLVSVFPAFYLNWGRFPQLAGVVVVPLAMALLFDLYKSDPRRSILLAASLLVAGLFLIHYRMFLFLLYGILALLAARLVETRSLHEVWKSTLRLVPVAVLAFVLALPWALTLLESPLGEQFFTRGPAAPEAYGLVRIEEPLSYPSSLWLFILSLVGSGLAAFYRKVEFTFLLAWSGIGFLLSNPNYIPGPFSGLLDTITWVSVMFVVESILVAYIPVIGLTFVRHGERLHRSLYAATVSITVLLGTLGTGFIAADGDETVHPQDLEAFTWIVENVPHEAIFATNMRIDPFVKTVQPVDAGIWITYFTGRKQLAPSLLYLLERPPFPEYDVQLRQMAQYEKRVGSFGSYLFLYQLGVTHLYTGAKGMGPMRHENLTISPWYSVLYQEENVTIAELKDLSDLDPIILRPAYDWSFLSDGYPAEREWGVDGVVLETYTFEEFKADYPIYLKEAGRYRISIRLMDFPRNDFDTDEPLSGILFELDGEPMLEHTYGTFTPIWLTLEVPYEGPGLHTLTIRSRDPGLPFRISLGDIVISQLEEG